MQRRTRTLLLLGVPLALAAAMLCWPDQTQEPPPVPAVDPTSVAPGEPVAPGDPATTPLPADALRVALSVREEERYWPPPAVLVQAVRRGDGAELPTELLAGAGSGGHAPDGRAGTALCSIDLLDGRRLVRQVVVEPEALQRPAIGAPVLLRGRVVDDRKRAVAGARIWFGEFDGAGAFREAATDEQGAFELDTPAGDGVPFLVRADGYAAQSRFATIDASARGELAMTLTPESVLQVQLAGGSAQMDAARIFVAPAATVSTELSVYPFFLQSLTRGGAVDAAGRSTLRGLPAGCTVAVTVVHPLAALLPPTEVKLASAHEQVVVPVRSTRPIAARFVDDAGQPIVGLQVVLHEQRRELRPTASLRLLPPYLGFVGCWMAWTDGDGNAVTGGPEPRPWQWTLRAPGYAGRDVPAPVQDAAAAVVLPRWRGGPVELRVLPPRGGVPFYAQRGAGGAVVKVDADQPWVVALPHAGRFHCELTTFVGERQHGSRSFPAVDATGPVEL